MPQPAYVTDLAFFVSGTGLALTAISAALTRSFLRAAPLAAPSAGQASLGVSVLKPLKGIDRETRENIESFFWQTHPRFELLFCVADPSDPAVELVRGLLREHPDVPARLLLGGSEFGPNPKIENLVPGYRAAKYPLLLISDSNIRVGPSYISLMEWQLGDDDLSCSVVTGRMPVGWPGRLERIFLGGFYARFMIMTHYLGNPCVMGKSMIFRRKAMDQIGGLETLAPYLAEDFVAGEKFRSMGLRKSIGRIPVHQVIGKPTFTSFWNRHLRWGQIRKTHALPAFAVELPFTNAIVSSALAAWAATQIGASGYVTFAGCLVFWLLMDLLALRSGNGEAGAHFPLAWLARELIHIPLWFHIAMKGTVTWKGRSWNLGGDGRLVSFDGPSEPEADGERGIAAAARHPSTPHAPATLWKGSTENPGKQGVDEGSRDL